MKRHKRPSKLEEARWKIHLDIDGNHQEVIDGAMEQVKKLVNITVGQNEIAEHDVTLSVETSIQERSKNKEGEPPKDLSRDAGLGQRY